MTLNELSNMTTIKRTHCRAIEDSVV